MRLYEIEEIDGIEEIDKLRYVRLVIVNIFKKMSNNNRNQYNIVYDDIIQYNIYNRI